MSEAAKTSKIFMCVVLEILQAAQPLLEEFAEVVPDEIPPGLLHMRDIHHYIDLLTEVMIPNKHLYWRSLRKLYF